MFLIPEDNSMFLILNFGGEPVVLQRRTHFHNRQGTVRTRNAQTLTKKIPHAKRRLWIRNVLYVTRIPTAGSELISKYSVRLYRTTTSWFCLLAAEIACFVLISYAFAYLLVFLFRPNRSSEANKRRASRTRWTSRRSILANFWQILRCPFSAVSKQKKKTKPNFARLSKYSFESSWWDLQDTHASAPLGIQKFSWIRQTERYKPHTVDLETQLKPFVPDFVPAVGEVDGFIKVPQTWAAIF